MEIQLLIDEIRKLPNCVVHPPTDYPNVEKEHFLPSDLKNFFKICGGIDLFIDCDYTIKIVPPKEFKLANPVIIGERAEEDISSNWYIIGGDMNSNYITIDLDKSRLGCCYDSFWDVHGVAGSCPIIATSFTELIERLMMSKGQLWYWLQEDFKSLGDAYDE
jgi:antitoxin YokJ